MANICTNIFHAQTTNKEDINIIESFIKDNFGCTEIEITQDKELDTIFESKWFFPEDLMKELLTKIIDKNSIFMRCLSVEYDNLYHSLWICDGTDWDEV